MYTHVPTRNHEIVAGNASLPPPAGPRPGAAFIARFLLISMAIVAVIALIVIAPLSVTLPLGFVFTAGLLGTFVLSALDRRQHRQDNSGRGRRDVSHPRTALRDPDAAGEVPAAPGALAALSITVVGLAFLAPEPIGVAMAAVGLAGLLILRLIATFAGWAPRGSAWATHRPAERAGQAA